jgi:hypothetical protein
MSYYCHSTVPLSTICDEYYHIDKDTVDNLIFLHTILPDVWSFTYMKTFTNIIMDLTCQKTSLLWDWNSENWPWHGWHVWHELIPILNLTMTCNNDEFIMTPRHSLSISWAWILFLSGEKLIAPWNAMHSLRCKVNKTNRSKVELTQT